MHPLRVQHFRNQRNSRVQREQLHSHILTEAYHSLKPIKWRIYKTMNKQGKLRNNETRNKQETKQTKNKQKKDNTFVFRSGP